jgi:DNA-binding FadR family transcriptional regulator
VLLDAFDRADVPAQILSLWSGARAPDHAQLAEIRRGYADIVDSCQSGDLERVPEVVRRLLGAYDLIYRASFSQSDGI